MLADWAAAQSYLVGPTTSRSTAPGDDCCARLEGLWYEESLWLPWPAAEVVKMRGLLTDISQFVIIFSLDRIHHITGRSSATTPPQGVRGIHRAKYQARSSSDLTWTRTIPMEGVSFETPGREYRWRWEDYAGFP